MKKGQTSVRGGIEDFLCPFTDMYITQGSGMQGGTYSHDGTMANDVRGLVPGIRYPYYAPCTVKCINVFPEYGEARWQSVNKVRFANGRIDYATFETVHDDSFNAKVGMIVGQGTQLGNMGKRGHATGVHCHIEISQSNDITFKKNKYGIYCFNNEYDTDDCYFMDDTNILNMKSANWKYLKDVPVEEEKPDKNYLVDGGTYKLLYAKCLRYTPNMGTNIVQTKNVDSATKKLLVNKTGDAILKVGTEITCLKISKESNGRVWGSYGNCWFCLQNVDGQLNVVKI